MKPKILLVFLLAAVSFAAAGFADRLPVGQTRFDVLADKARGKTPLVSWASTVILVAPERLRPTLRRWAGKAGGIVGSPLDLNFDAAPGRTLGMVSYHYGHPRRPPFGWTFT